MEDFISTITHRFFLEEGLSWTSDKKSFWHAQVVKDLGSEVATISKDSLDADQANPVSIRNVKAIASYNWLDSEDPAIVVPGSPPLWHGRPMPYPRAVRRDSETIPGDENARRSSNSPLLPLIAAVTHQAPSFQLSHVDFVTDLDGLLHLWKWASGGKDSRVSFKIDIEIAGTRTALVEPEKAKAQKGLLGYRRNFERVSTTPMPGCRGTSGHYRIVTYDLGGLTLLVRFKADACMLSKNIKLVKNPEVDPVDEVTSALEGSSVERPSGKATVPTSLRILTRGALVPHSSLVEFKTRSMMSMERFEWDDAYPQILLSQTRHIFVCVHEHGIFQAVRKRTLEELETEAVATKAQEALRKLSKALEEIRDVGKERGNGAKLSLVCKDGGDIVVYEREAKEGCLPDDMLKRFTE